MRLLALAALLGCGQVSAFFQCELDTQCLLEGVAGRCEFKGVCSYPDESCPSRRRYGPGAGSLAGICVGSEADAGAPGTDAPPGGCVPSPEYCGDGLDQDCIGDPPDPPCDENERPDGALDVSAGGTFTADLRWARDDHTPSCGEAGGRDLFYQVDLPGDEVLYVDTHGTDFPAVLSVYPAPCADLASVSPTCLRDACGRAELAQLAAPLSGSICLVVDQADAQTAVFGNSQLTLRVLRTGALGTAGGGAGDTCTHAENGDASCGAGGAGDAGHWFAICEDERETVAHTCSNATTYDSVLHFRADYPWGAEVACDDDGCSEGGRSYLQATLSGPGLYWAVVDGKDGSCGPYELALE